MVPTLHVPLAMIEDGGCPESEPFLVAKIFSYGNGM
jgi:hypothetical protein